MTQENKNRIQEVVEKALQDMKEKKVGYDTIVSYKNPYIFVCTKAIAKQIKKIYDVDKNNIFYACETYFKLCVRKPLRRY